MEFGLLMATAMWPSRRRKQALVSRDPDPADAFFAINHFAAWVSNADTKAGFVAAAAAVLGGGLVSQIPRMTTLLPFCGLREWSSLALIAAAGVALLFTLVFLMVSLRPRGYVESFSRFSWPDVSQTPLEVLVQAPSHDVRREAWQQARNLAIIAAWKFSAVRRSLWCLAAAAAFGLAWSLVTPGGPQITQP